MVVKEKFIIFRDWLLNKFVLKRPWVSDLAKWAFAYSKISRSSLYQSFVLTRARKFAETNPYGGIGFSIETVLSCNSHCIMCGHSARDMRGFMDDALFRKIISQISALGIPEVGLSVYGEPLIDPLFIERLCLLRKVGMGYSFFTNASLLDQKMTDRLFSIGGLSRINFSVCGYRKEVYEGIMRGLDRDTVYANIAYFLKRKGSAKLPQVSVSTVKTKLNLPEMNDFVRFWRSHKGVDNIITADLWERLGGKAAEEIGNISHFHSRSGWKAPCLQLWGPFYIYFDGRVAPCCDDNDLRELIIGDLNRQSLEEVIKGQEIADLRKCHLENTRSKHLVCGRCFHDSVWFWP